ncbi:MAG: PKD domain-containing protein [Cytophagales bacterium]|nr:PKD domain-containing protein [Cytophagales bacterium]
MIKHVCLLGLILVVYQAQANGQQFNWLTQSGHYCQSTDWKVGDVKLEFIGLDALEQSLYFSYYQNSNCKPTFGSFIYPGSYMHRPTYYVKVDSAGKFKWINYIAPTKNSLALVEKSIGNEFLILSYVLKSNKSYLTAQLLDKRTGQMTSPRQVAEVGPDEPFKARAYGLCADEDGGIYFVNVGNLWSSPYKLELHKYSKVGGLLHTRNVDSLFTKALPLVPGSYEFLSTNLGLYAHKDKLYMLIADSTHSYVNMGFTKYKSNALVLYCFDTSLNLIKKQRLQLPPFSQGGIKLDDVLSAYPKNAPFQLVALDSNLYIRIAVIPDSKIGNFSYSDNNYSYWYCWLAVNLDGNLLWYKNFSNAIPEIEPDFDANSLRLKVYRGGLTLVKTDDTSYIAEARTKHYSFDKLDRKSGKRLNTRVLNIFNYSDEDSVAGNDAYLFSDPCQKGYIIVAGERQFGLELDGKRIFTSDSSRLFVARFTDESTYRADFKINSSCLQADFINKSSPQLDRLRWYFGDGDSSTDRHPSHTYQKSGFYPIQLTASNTVGCKLSVFDTVYAALPPVARIGLSDTLGCQWVGYQFYDSSAIDSLRFGGPARYRWDFGDGQNDTARQPAHLYTRSGKYDVKLLVDNVFCVDSTVRTQAVDILEAPKPGFLADFGKCAPTVLSVTNKSEGQVVSTRYTLSTGETFNVPNFSTTLSQSGDYQLKQELLGPTGCITRDSLFFRLAPSYTADLQPNMLRATVIGRDSVLVEWQADSIAERYHVLRLDKQDFSLIIESDSTAFIGTKIKTTNESYTYKVIGIDSCGHPSSESRIAKTILLSAENQDNAYAVLNWTPYEQWAMGVADYVLEYAANQLDFKVLTSLSATDLGYTDPTYFDSTARERCYRVVAQELGGNQQLSRSNTVCLPYQPTLLIPNAFSPNGDGINDYFSVYRLNINKISIIITNRWGGIVWQSDSLSSYWDGTQNGEPLPTGVYALQIYAQADNYQTFSHKGSVMLLK